MIYNSLPQKTELFWEFDRFRFPNN